MSPCYANVPDTTEVSGSEIIRSHTQPATAATSVVSRPLLDASEHGGATPSRAHGSAWLLAVLVVVAIYLPFTVAARVAGFVADDAIYLLMADYYSGLYAELPMLHYLRSVTHLPPLYSVLLAAAGGLSTQLDIAHLVQTLVLIAALLAWALVARRLLARDDAAIVVLLTLAALPATVLFSTEIWSEFLYLLLTGVAIKLALAAERRPGLWLGAALLVGLGAITRSFGIVAMIAIMASVAVHARAWLLPVIVIASAPLLAVQYLELGGGTNYLEIFQARVADAGALRQFLSSNLDALGDAFVALFSLRWTPFTAIVLATALGLSAIAWLRRLHALRFDAIYVLGYLVVLVIWPFPNVAYRLVYPLAPLFVIYAALGAGVITRLAWPRYRSFAGVLTPLILLAVTLSQSWPLATRYFDEALPAELEPWRSSRYWLAATDPASAIEDLQVKQAMTDLMRDAQQTVPADGCIYAFHPQAVMLYSRRASFPAPAGIERPAQPACGFHILLSDGYAAASATALWPGYEVLQTARTADGVAAVLVRYPRP